MHIKCVWHTLDNVHVTTIKFLMVRHQNWGTDVNFRQIRPWKAELHTTWIHWIFLVVIYTAQRLSLSLTKSTRPKLQKTRWLCILFQYIKCRPQHVIFRWCYGYDQILACRAGTLIKCDRSMKTNVWTTFPKGLRIAQTKFQVSIINSVVPVGARALKIDDNMQIIFHF